MVEAIRTFISKLDALKPQSSREACVSADALKKDLVAAFATLCENLAIELSYAVVLVNTPGVRSECCL